MPKRRALLLSRLNLPVDYCLRVSTFYVAVLLAVTLLSILLPVFGDSYPLTGDGACLPIMATPFYCYPEKNVG